MIAAAVLLSIVTPNAGSASDSASSACETDDDCPEGARCRDGLCKRKKKPPQAPAVEKKPEAAPTSADKNVSDGEWGQKEGHRCDDDHPCEQGLTCWEAVCVSKANLPAHQQWGLGFEYQVSPGLDDEGANKTTLHTAALVLEVPALLPPIRGVERIGYTTGGGVSGLRLGIGFGIPITLVNKPGLKFHLEPGFDPVQFTALFSPPETATVDGKPAKITATQLDFVSTVSLRGTLQVGAFFVAITPIGFELSLFDIDLVTTETETGTARARSRTDGEMVFRKGVNYLGRFTVGFIL